MRALGKDHAPGVQELLPAAPRGVHVVVGRHIRQVVVAMHVAPGQDVASDLCVCVCVFPFGVCSSLSSYGNTWEICRDTRVQGPSWRNVLKKA